MKLPSHLRDRPGMLLIVLIVLITGHAILFYLLRQAGIPHSGVSGVLFSSVVLLVLAKHLGLFAALLGLLQRLIRRRFRTGNTED